MTTRDRKDFDFFPHNQVFLIATNDFIHYQQIKLEITRWINVYHNEKEFDAELKKIVLKICKQLFKETEDPIYQMYSVDEDILLAHTTLIKNHFIDTLYRQTATMSKIHYARFVEIAGSDRTVAIFRSKTVNPHIAIVLRKSTNSKELVCHLANLDCGGFGSGVYGSRAKESFLARITEYID